MHPILIPGQTEESGCCYCYRARIWLESSINLLMLQQPTCLGAAVRMPLCVCLCDWLCICGHGCEHLCRHVSACIYACCLHMQI